MYFSRACWQPILRNNKKETSKVRLTSLRGQNKKNANFPPLTGLKGEFLEFQKNQQPHTNHKTA